MLLFRIEKVAYIYEKVLWCGIEPGISCITHNMFITHQTICLWQVGGLSNIPQTDYYSTLMYVNNKLLNGMLSVVAFYQLAIYIAYFSIIISMSTIVICICHAERLEQHHNSNILHTYVTTKN